MKIVSTFVWFSLIVFSSYAQVDAQFGIYVKNLTVNQREGVFYADLYWWIKLPSDLDPKRIDEYSKIEFVNGTEATSNDVESKIAKGYYYKTGFYKGEFRFQPDYHDYPVDIQKLPIIIESVNLTEDLVRLVPDKVASQEARVSRSMEGSIIIPGFKIISADYEKESKLYESNFGDPDISKETKYSRVTFEISIERISESFVLKILTPNLLLLVITYLVFFIPARQLEVAVGCTVTSLLASIALQLTINGSLPEIGYLTNADKLFHLFYFLITLALVQTVITFNLDKSGHKKRSYKLEIIGRFVFPTILLLGILIILVF